jgi:hypothetical protein
MQEIEIPMSGVLESGRIQQQRRNRAPIEVGTDGGVDPHIGRTVLQRAGSDYRPEAFAEIPPSLAPSSLGHMSIHHHETLGVFGGVIGGLDFRMGDEMKVILPVEVKAMG